MEALRLASVVAAACALACSPEASRTRDGGPGGDIGNKDLVSETLRDPRTADTTLMPGRAIAPVDRASSSKPKQ